MQYYTGFHRRSVNIDTPQDCVNVRCVQLQQPTDSFNLSTASKHLERILTDFMASHAATNSETSKSIIELSTVVSKVAQNNEGQHRPQDEARSARSPAVRPQMVLFPAITDLNILFPFPSGVWLAHEGPRTGSD